jgi:GNAT superfamily N-acetyltransferase
VTKLELVPNTPDYYDFIRRLRNDPDVQKGFVEQVSISPEQQVVYMAKYAQCYYVCLSAGVPVGYIGAIEGDIRIATHPEHQGKGVGLFMVREFVKRHPDCTAKVKFGNSASLGLFRRAGFEEVYVILRPSPSSDFGVDCD